MPLFDSVIHAMGTAGTGGFSNRTCRWAPTTTRAVAEMLIMAFMFLFGTNFFVYFARCAATAQGFPQ